MASMWRSSTGICMSPPCRWPDRELRRTPPTAAVWLMARMHPAFRARTRRARTTLAERPWRKVTSHWFEEERTTWIDRISAMQDEDPATLDDRALAEHLGRARLLVVSGYRRHFELHGDDLLPVGLLIARGEEWGLDPSTVTAALSGASPLSTGSTVPPAWQLVTGYDLDALAWCELQTGRTLPVSASPPPVDLRPGVPAADHAELEALLDDARHAVALRDDNGAIIAAWPMGLLRRAMLEAGRRLGLEPAAAAVELTVEELVTSLGAAEAAHGDAPRDELADRARRRADERRAASALDAPNSLGPEFAIPPLSALPRPLALIGAAQLATADNMFERAAGAVGIGDRPYTGRALVVDDPHEAFALVEPGDVLITSATSPSWNVVLAHAGALVTTAGGLLSHAAVIARELGIPAVLGDVTATRRLRTGATVTVDPIAATVTTDLVSTPQSPARPGR